MPQCPPTVWRTGGPGIPGRRDQGQRCRASLARSAVYVVPEEAKHFLAPLDGVKPQQRLSDADYHELLSFLKVNPQLARGHQLKESFRQFVVQGDLEGLDGWREQAASSGLRPFQSLAGSFGKDYQAIQMALTTRWSNAQCEGQICRVKLIKRLGYGRAKLDLLRQRVLHRRKAV